MPSRLAAGLSARRLNQLLAEPNENGEAVSQWLGYMPDIDPSLAGLSAMSGSSYGLLPYGEILSHEIGWSAVDSANLPLGDDGAGAAALSAAFPQRIQLLDYFQRSPTSDNEIVAATRAGGGLPSHVFRLPSSVTWANVPPRGGYPVGASLPTATALNFAGSSGFPSAATFSLGVPSGSPYAGVAGRGAVAQPVHIIAHPTNPVAMWPCFRGGEVLEYDYPIEAIGTIAGFMANSVVSFDGRMCFLNWSSTASGANPQSMAFSVVGDPTDIDPASVGAGFIVADEMEGVGLTILRLGNMLAGYYTSGIVLFVKHQPPLAPFAIQYLTHQIHAIGPRSVCALDRDRHFVVADQGWFIIDSTGAIQEVGRVGTPYNSTTRKWLDTFFSGLNREAPNLVSCVFNAAQRLVRISFASRDANVSDTVWYYEPDSDRVWPAAPYGDTGIQTQLVAPSVVSAAATWATMTSPWFLTSGKWSSYSARLGFPVNYHGTRTGFVYVQSDAQGHLREQDDGSSVSTTYSYASPLTPIENPHIWKEARRLYVEYINLSGPDASLSVTVDQNTQSLSRTMDGNAAGLSAVTYINTVGLGGTHHGFTVSGSAPVAINRFFYSYVPRLGERKDFGI